MSKENKELRNAGLKVTLPRVKILQILESIEGDQHHMSAEDVYRALLDQGEDVGLATVYRVLTQFENAGLVVRHNFEGGHSVFELSTDEHHEHDGNRGGEAVSPDSLPHDVECAIALSLDRLASKVVSDVSCQLAGARIAPFTLLG